MELRKRLLQMKKDELTALARRLGVENFSALNKAELVEYLLVQAPEKLKTEFKPEKKKKWIKPLTTVGSIAGIVGILLALWPILFPPAAYLGERDSIIKELTEALQDECLGNAEDRTAAIEKLKEGNTGKANALIKKAIQNEQCPPAENYYHLGNTYFLSKTPDYKQALAAYLQAEKLNPVDSKYLGSVGQAYSELAEYTKAVRYFEKALALDIKKFGKTSPEVAIHWNHLGCAWDSLGEYRKAIEYYEKALAGGLKTYGEGHPDVATRWSNLGVTYINLGKYHKAIEYFEKALASDLKTYGEGHTKVATRWNNLGSAWNSLGDYRKAIDYYDKSLGINLKTYGEEHPHVATTWNNLGSAWASLGVYHKAIDFFEKTQAINIKKYGELHPRVAATWNNLGVVYGNSGDYQKAVDYFKKALPVFEKTLGSEHQYTKGTREDLAATEEKLKEKR